MEKKNLLNKKKRCPSCGQKVPEKKRKYFLTGILLLVTLIVLKASYNRVFKKEVVLRAINNFLHLQTVKRLNLSKETKEKILYLAGIAAKEPPAEPPPNPGEEAERKGIKKKHPVTIIPGMANTNLELWNPTQSNSFFRKKIWGSHSTFTFILHNRSGWFSSMKLNEKTGLDPEKVKVRASPGLESSDFSFPGMWFWWKIVKNLSHIGYDIADIHFAAFDWRLGMDELERRDGYFTRLKADMEHQANMNKEKVLVIAHSLGSLVFHYFLQWVSQKDPLWSDKYVHAIVYIGPPLLGAPKAISSLITGDALDIAEMGVIQNAILELLVGAEQRIDLFKTWTSMIMLLPKGGSRIWEGPEEELPPDLVKQSRIVSVKQVGADLPLSSTPLPSPEKENKNKNQPNKEIPDLPLRLLPSTASPLVLLPIESTFKIIKERVTPYNKEVLNRMLAQEKESTWTNPLLSSLPHAPRMRIYSFYGVNIPTERAYILTQDKKGYRIDRGTTDGSKSIYKGIYTVDGDGTVPVVSAGYMGYSGWKSKRLNPSRIKTVNKEYSHSPSSSMFDLRGGPRASQHINILGNTELIADLLLLSSGGAVEERIISFLPEISDRINKRKNSAHQ